MNSPPQRSVELFNPVSKLITKTFSYYISITGQPCFPLVVIIKPLKLINRGKRGTFSQEMAIDSNYSLTAGITEWSHTDLSSNMNFTIFWIHETLKRIYFFICKMGITLCISQVCCEDQMSTNDLVQQLAPRQKFINFSYILSLMSLENNSELRALDATINTTLGISSFSVVFHRSTFSTEWHTNLSGYL